MGEKREVNRLTRQQYAMLVKYITKGLAGNLFKEMTTENIAEVCAVDLKFTVTRGNVAGVLKELGIHTGKGHKGPVADMRVKLEAAPVEARVAAVNWLGFLDEMDVSERSTDENWKLVEYDPKSDRLYLPTEDHGMLLVMAKFWRGIK